MKLDWLGIRSFRGIRDEEIEVAGKSLFVYGENGTGKSSIVDSLDFFFNGSVFHLEGAQALSTRRHAPHVESDARSLSISLRFKGQQGTFARSLAEPPQLPSTAAAYCENVAASRFILRRQQLLAFILEQAAPRYQQLAGLIGADALDSIEVAWKNAADESASQVEDVSRRMSNAKSLLEEALGHLEDLMETTILGALNSRLAALGETPVNDFAAAEARKVSSLASAGQKDRAEESVRLSELSSLASRIATRIGSLASHETLWTETSALREEAATLRELRFKDVLSQAKILVRDYELSECPVCLQRIDGESLDAELTTRIAKSDLLASRLNAINASQQRLREDLNALSGLLRQFQDRLHKDESLRETFESSKAVEGWAREFESRLHGESHTLHLGTFVDFKEAPLLSGLHAECAILQTKIASRIANLAQSENDQRIVAVISLLTRVIDSAGTIAQLHGQIEQLQTTAATLRFIYETLVSTKKSQIQAIYTQLEADIARFYDAIHPNELHGNVKLEVVSNRRGSAELKMAFADKPDVDPRAYNSEAHLDSLGLCIFLAFAKRFNVGVSMLALDDVVSSVDAPHRRRICDLLFAEFVEYQLFITTHDALWFDQLLAAQKAQRFQPVRSLRIVSWSLDDGPQFADHSPRWEYLEEKLSTGDKQGAASLGRKTLEWVLFELGISLQVQATLRRDARYDVGSLLEPVLSRAKKLIPTFNEDYEAAIMAIRSNALIGNLLTHNNPYGDGASLSDVKAFTSAVRGIHDIFWCDQCEGFARYHQDAQIIKCSCAQNGKEWRTR